MCWQPRTGRELPAVDPVGNVICYLSCGKRYRQCDSQAETAGSQPEELTRIANKHGLAAIGAIAAFTAFTAPLVHPIRAVP